MPFEFRKSVYYFSSYEQKAFSRPNQKQISSIKKCQVITSIEPEHMPFEFRKSVYQFSGYEQKAFYHSNRKQIFSDNNFLPSLPSKLKISRLNFENPSINTQVMSQKPVFEGHFQFSWRNRKQIPKTKGRGPYSALNSNYWRLNFENRSSSFRAMREQPTDIHTYRHTDIHTYRQTDGTKLLYRLILEGIALIYLFYFYDVRYACFTFGYTKPQTLPVSLQKKLVIQ